MWNPPQMWNPAPLCFPCNYDNYFANDVISTLNSQYDMDEHISVILWIISRDYAVNKEVTDFTFVAHFTFLSLPLPFLWHKNCGYTAKGTRHSPERGSVVKNDCMALTATVEPDGKGWIENCFLFFNIYFTL